MLQRAVKAALAQAEISHFWLLPHPPHSFAFLLFDDGYDYDIQTVLELLD